MRNPLVRNKPAPVEVAPASPPAGVIERATLAAKIAERQAERQAHARMTAAQMAAEERVWAARAALTAAADGLARAKAEAAQHEVDLVVGTAGEPPVSIKAARAAQLDAEDTLEAAIAARDTLATRLREAGNQSDKLAPVVKDAAVAVLKTAPALDGLVEDLDRLQRELFDKTRVFQWLAQQGLIRTERIATGPFTFDTPLAGYVHLRATRQMDEWQGLEAPGVQRWHDALAALQSDPTAALPG